MVRITAESPVRGSAEMAGQPAVMGRFGPMRTSPNRLIATVFGAVYLLVGLLGFFVTSGTGFFATKGATLIIFDVNPLHNIIHLAIGAALLYSGMNGVTAAKSVNTTIGGVYLLVGILGLFLVGTSLNIIALNGADNVLHLASAVLLLGVALSQDKATVATARA
jgi:hypothetical protein